METAKLFGRQFAQAILDLSPGEWHGPVLSGYGVHLVYVHRHEEAAAPEFSAVQERVAQDWLEDRRRELQQEYVDDVVGSYEVVFEDAAPGKAEQQVEARLETSE